MLRFGLDEATVRADGGRGEVKGDGDGGARLTSIHMFWGYARGWRGGAQREKGLVFGLWGRRIGPAVCPPTAKARPSVDLKT